MSDWLLSDIAQLRAYDDIHHHWEAAKRGPGDQLQRRKDELERHPFWATYRRTCLTREAREALKRWTSTKLAAVLSLEDRLSGPMGKAQGAMLAAGAAVAGAGLKIGSDWDAATKTIVDGTGATGAALEDLQGAYQQVARFGKGAAGAIADVNTHLGLTGDEAAAVAGALLKTSHNTGFVTESMAAMGGGVQGATQYLDVFDAGVKSSGVSSDRLARQINKAIPQFAEMGFSAEQTAAHVIELANQTGHQGLIPALVASKAELREGGEILGDYSSLAETSAGSVQEARDATFTWKVALAETKAATIAYLGPAGDMLAGVGSLTVGVGSMLPAISKWNKGTGDVTKVQKALNLVMKMNPIGLVIAAVGALVAVYVIWQDEINAFLKGAWNAFLGAVEGGINLLRPLAGLIGVDLPANLDSYKFSVDESAGSTTDAAAEIAVLKAEAEATAPVMSGTLAPAVETVTEEIEAFDLAAVKLTGQLQQHTKPAIKDIGDMLEVSGLQAGAAVVPWGFFADEVSTDVPNAMDIVMDSIMEVPPTAEQVAADLRAIAPTWGQGLMDGLKSTFSPDNVGATFSRAFEGGGGALGAIQSLASQAGSLLADGLAAGLDTLVPGLGQLAGPLLAAAEALGNKIGRKFAEAFGAPSEAVVAARSTMDAYAATIEADSVNQERLADWMAGGFTEAHAKIVTHFQDMAIAAGEGSTAGVDAWLEYQAAIEAGDDALAASILVRVAGWGDVSDAAQVAADEQLAIANQLTADLASIAEQRAAKHLEFAVAAMEADRDAALSGMQELHDSEMAAMQANFEATNAMMEVHRGQQLADVDADIAARQAALDEGYVENLAAFEAANAAKLDALKAANAAELAEIESARDALLSGVEAEISRELRYAKAGADLQYDLGKAAGDAELEQAAHVAHAIAIAKLEEQDAKAILYAAAEALLRASHQSEIDAINVHHDDLAATETARYDVKVATETARYDAEVATEIARHDAASDALNAEHEKRTLAINKFFDDAAAFRLAEYEKAVEVKQAQFDEAYAAEELFWTTELSILKTGHDGSLAAWDAYYDQLEADARASAAAMSAIAASVALPATSGGGYGGARAFGGAGHRGPHLPRGRERAGALHAQRVGLREPEQQQRRRGHAAHRHQEHRPSVAAGGDDGGSRGRVPRGEEARRGLKGERMPGIFTNVGADRMYDGFFSGGVYVSLHTASPPTEANKIQDSWYSDVQTPSGDWSEHNDGDYREVDNDDDLDFGTTPTSGSLSDAEVVALATGAVMSYRQPDLVRPGPKSINIQNNRNVLIEAGELRIQIDKTGVIIP